MLKIDVAPFFGMLSMRIDRLNAVVIHERGGGGHVSAQSASNRRSIAAALLLSTNVR